LNITGAILQYEFCVPPAFLNMLGTYSNYSMYAPITIPCDWEKPACQPCSVLRGRFRHSRETPVGL